MWLSPWWCVLCFQLLSTLHWWHGPSHAGVSFLQWIQCEWCWYWAYPQLLCGFGSSVGWQDGAALPVCRYANIRHVRKPLRLQEDMPEGKPSWKIFRNMKYQLLNILETVFDEFSSWDRGMPIASNPLPPNLRVLRSVGQAAGPQMVLRHEENNSEPKQGSEPAKKHMKNHEILWNLMKSHCLAVSKLKSMKLEALSKLRGGGRDLRERRMRHQGLRDLAMKCESAECREVNLMNVYESATSIATKEMRAHMDQDPNIEAFTTDGWLRTGDKGGLLRAGRTFFEASSNTPQPYLQWDYETTNYPQFGKGSIDRNGMMMHDVRLHRWKQLLMPVWTLQRDYQSWWAQACFNICLDNTAKEMQETCWQAAFWLNGCKQRNSVSCSMMDEKLRWWREDLTLWGSRREEKMGNATDSKLNNWKESDRASLWHSINWFGCTRWSILWFDLFWSSCPWQVENVCRQWPPVFDCIAFSCPHAQLGETVGLAAVLRDGDPQHRHILQKRWIDEFQWGVHFATSTSHAFNKYVYDVYPYIR